MTAVHHFLSPTLHDWLVVLVFLVGYGCIIFEHKLGVNKTAFALLIAGGCWILECMEPAWENNLGELHHHLAEVSKIVFFLLGAMTIVETIHAHGGLNIVTRFMHIRSKTVSLWVMGFVTFFLSSVLDNLTSTIVMVTMLKKIVRNHEDRLLFGAVTVIAANAGGAWTPVGDLTTTMLWIGGQVTTWPLIRNLLLPSILCLVSSLTYFSFHIGGDHILPTFHEKDKMAPHGKLIFILGVSSLVSIPLFKSLIGLPPFMGMILMLGVMWLVTEILHNKYHERNSLRISQLFSRLDISSMLFFLGILLAVAALQTAGILQTMAVWLDKTFPSKELISVILGVLSAVVDNVPLLAACMGMYNMQQFPPDSVFWHLTAFTVGTGGSLLLIGSAAGVVFMSLEKVDFFYYLRKATVGALIGYLVGVASILLLVG